MKAYSSFICLPGLALCCILASLLPGCGPREVGEGTSTYTPPSHGGGQPVAEAMRYPMTGANNTQKLLYHANRPEIMEITQKIQDSEFKRRIGLQPDGEEETWREVPKERSPFRQ